MQDRARAMAVTENIVTADTVIMEVTEQNHPTEAVSKEGCCNGI